MENSNGSPQITNFYEIDDDSAKNIVTSYDEALPKVSNYLKPCAVCGSRNVGCCDKSRQCNVSGGELWYQCLYCSKLEVSKEASAGGSADFYFLMDNSGSMSRYDREEASKAVKKMIQSLQGNGNTYSFVAWGSYAGYIFRNETNLSKMTAALESYENGTCGYGGGTFADVALNYISSDVASSKKAVRIILVTDGYFADLRRAVAERNNLLKGQKNIEILAIGVNGADQHSLASIGTVPAFSKVIGSSSALTSTFEQIAEVLKKKGNNF